LGVGLFNGVSQILPRPTLVAMATKFELKLAITRPICEVSLRFLDPPGGFRGWATNFEPKVAVIRLASDIYPRYLRLA